MESPSIRVHLTCEFSTRGSGLRVRKCQSRKQGAMILAGCGEFGVLGFAV